MTPRRSSLILDVVSVALFMVTLDNLVVSTALPSLRVDLGAGVEELQWVVNAYTLAVAVLLLPASALGERFGRRRVLPSRLGDASVVRGSFSAGRPSSPPRARSPRWLLVPAR